MSDHCGTTAEEGNAVCVPGSCSCSSETQNNAPVLLSLPTMEECKSMLKQFATGFKKAISLNNIEEKTHVEENS